MLIDPQSWRTPHARVQSVQLVDGEPDQLHIFAASFPKLSDTGGLNGVRKVPERYQKVTRSPMWTVGLSSTLPSRVILPGVG